MLALLRERFPEAFKAIAPLVAVAILLQVAVVHAPLTLFLEFLLGSILATLGILLLFVGVDMGILPMGRFIGAELPNKGSLKLIVAIAFALGFATTVAEPDVLVLADQVQSASQGAISAPPLIYVIAAGVGAFSAVALSRVVYGHSLRGLLAATYLVMIFLTFVAPADFISLAYDAGSVTTGVLTTPVLIALAIGLSTVLAGRSAVADGFGLLGLGSAGAIIAVLLMGAALQ